jgi:hypothetical protein
LPQHLHAPSQLDALLRHRYFGSGKMHVIACVLFSAGFENKSGDVVSVLWNRECGELVHRFILASERHPEARRRPEVSVMQNVD